MNDLARFRAFLEGAGIKVSASSIELRDNGGHAVLLRAGSQPKVGGYNEFSVIVVFDAQGNLLEIGAWE